MKWPFVSRGRHEFAIDCLVRADVRAENERLRESLRGAIDAMELMQQMREGPPNAIGNWDWAYDRLRNASQAAKVALTLPELEGL